MFDFFKKKKTPELIIGSPVKGKTVPLSSVNDPTFSEGMLGKGAAILPSEGKIYAPADGTIETLFDTFMHSVLLQLMVWRFWSMWVWIQSKWAVMDLQAMYIPVMQ